MAEIDNENEELNNSNQEMSDVDFLNFFGKPKTPEEIEQMKRERATQLAAKGFLPENDGFSETMSSPQEVVESNPRQFIIEECIPACQELWAKNIYTYMVSDHENVGECWIEIIADSLSDENKEIFMQLSGEDVRRFSYHKGCVNFGVKVVGIEGQRRLLELAQQFKMQDVPKDQAYITEEQFLMDYCNCYNEYENPNYKPMTDHWEANVELEQMYDYMEKYDEWQASDASKPTLRRFAPEKVSKSIAEYAAEHKMVYEDDRVYLSSFHYRKHLNYVKYVLENQAKNEEQLGGMGKKNNDDVNCESKYRR